MEQRNPKGRADWKETQQVQSTGPDPNWMERVRVRKETHIQPEPQDNACALHQGTESQRARGADCEVRCGGECQRERQSSWTWVRDAGGCGLWVLMGKASPETETSFRGQVLPTALWAVQSP